jgi:MoaA/NifB/PqqE/SkfB family radical SAM enzyme
VQPQLADGVKWRDEPFGSVVYVPSWDSFFALDKRWTAELRAALRSSPRRDPASEARRRPEANGSVSDLRALGILRGGEEASPGTPRTPGLLGSFGSGPLGDRPLLVNCFATAHCPLQCTYCYADDLMMRSRGEPENDLAAHVLGTADAIEAMVAVVTGGEPLARPRQSAELIRKLATTKAVVVDSSGVGDIDGLLPAMAETRAHLRISLDSADPDINDAQRPIRKPFQADGSSSWRLALRSLQAAQSARIPVSVQTVLAASNATVTQLAALRDLLTGMGVRKWVLHVVAVAGRARKHASSPRSAQPGQAFLDELLTFVSDSARQDYPLLIRVTDSNQAPNSVLLIDSTGDLLTEGADGNGKITLGSSGDDRSVLSDAIARELNLAGHYSRYLNCDVVPRVVAGI